MVPTRGAEGETENRLKNRCRRAKRKRYSIVIEVKFSTCQNKIKRVRWKKWKSTKNENKNQMIQ